MSNYTMLGADILPKILTTTKWQERLADAIKDYSGAKPSVGDIDKLVKWEATMKLKMFPGGDPILYISANAKIKPIIVEAYLQLVEQYRGKDVKEGALANIERLTVDVGKMTEKITSGIGYAGEGAGKTVGVLPIVAIIAVAGVAGYLIFSGAKGVKLLP